MPALPVLDRPTQARASIFERGDHIYLTSPVQLFTPTDQQIEEFAFSTQVKKTAPNENIVWFKGQYVEADNPNGNGAQWTANELGIKSLTPMLMPVTVMHDPRTAVGTIADVKLLTPENDSVPRARIDTVLALWGHRFPEAVHEAELNAQQGTLMQSMECYSPWYACSECGATFHKLPGGAEQANWCDHLKASNPSAGYVDLGQRTQTSNASRILGDVCFTGTGLIYGTRGARGAYSEAHLESFQDELAAYHHTAHTETATSRSASMGLVQIEQSELDTLRKERDDARAETTAEKSKRETAETATAAAEAAKASAEGERDTAKTELQAEKEKTAQASLKETRMGSLGDGFTAKLGDFTKQQLTDAAATEAEDAWDNRLKTLEEAYAVKRDAKAEGSSTTEPETATANGGDPPDFKFEELAKLNVGNSSDQPSVPGNSERSRVVTSLASAFKPAKKDS